MKKNLYYRATLGRSSVFKDFLFSVFLTFCLPIRLLIEVFTRKNFGERYFRLSAAIVNLLILGLLPVAIVFYKNHYGSSAGMSDPFHSQDAQQQAPAAATLMPHYLLWYIYLVAFLFVCVRHKIAQMHNPSVFDFGKYSLSTGDINPIFWKIQIPMIKTDLRLIECLLEPLPFLVAGIFLYWIGQNLGMLFIVSSIFYGLGYCSVYRHGDYFVMDKIDEIIMNEELEKSFVLDANEEQTRGFRFRGRKPESQEMRRQIMPLFIEDDDEIAEAK